MSFIDRHMLASHYIRLQVSPALAGAFHHRRPLRRAYAGGGRGRRRPDPGLRMDCAVALPTRRVPRSTGRQRGARLPSRAAAPVTRSFRFPPGRAGVEMGILCPGLPGGAARRGRDPSETSPADRGTADAAGASPFGGAPTLGAGGCGRSARQIAGLGPGCAGYPAPPSVRFVQSGNRPRCRMARSARVTIRSESFRSTLDLEDSAPLCTACDLAS